MNYYTIFKAIKEEYGEEIALTAVQIYTINLTPSFYTKDAFYENASEFLRKEARKVLWETDDDTFFLCWKVFGCIHEWESRQSLQGLGGCVAKTFKQLVEEYEAEYTEEEKPEILKESDYTVNEPSLKRAESPKPASKQSYKHVYDPLEEEGSPF